MAENLDVYVKSKSIYSRETWNYPRKSLRTEFQEWIEENNIELEIICADGSGITVLKFKNVEDKLHFALLIAGW